MLNGLLRRLGEGLVSGPVAKEILRAMWEGAGSADEIIEGRGLRQVSDEDTLARLVDTVLEAHPDAARQFREGRPKVLGFLVGQAMKASRGKANPQRVSALMRERLTG